MDYKDYKIIIVKERAMSAQNEPVLWWVIFLIIGWTLEVEEFAGVRLTIAAAAHKR